MGKAMTDMGDAKIRVSAGQFAPGQDKAGNLAEITRLVEAAAREGVRVLILPELAMYRRIDASLSEAIASAETLDGHFVTEVLALSAKHSMLIAVGIYEKMPVDAPNQNLVYNTLVIADEGLLLHAYRKVHLYDAFAARESDMILAGSDLPPVLEVDGFRIGFVICYDIRFPELFRTLTDRGANIIAVATAWARGVGKEEHWDVLTRSRAIENTSYVVASGEVSAMSVGRSRIIDPLGYLLGDAGEKKGALVVADIEAARLSEVRETLPSLKNRRVSVRHELDTA